jgi:hypothetical protein
MNCTKTVPVVLIYKTAAAAASFYMYIFHKLRNHVSSPGNGVSVTPKTGLLSHVKVHGLLQKRIHFVYKLHSLLKEKVTHDILKTRLFL